MCHLVVSPLACFTLVEQDHPVAVFRSLCSLDPPLTALRVKGQETPLTSVSPKYNLGEDESELFEDVRSHCVSVWEMRVFHVYERECKWITEA